jgi:hypothetical protein
MSTRRRIELLWPLFHQLNGLTQPLLTKNVALRSNKNDRLSAADHAVVIVAAIVDLVAMVLQVDPDKLVAPIQLHNAQAVQPVVALDNPRDLHMVAVVMDQADTVVAVKADDQADQNVVAVAADETVMVLEVAEAVVVVMTVVVQPSPWLLPARSL